VQVFMCVILFILKISGANLVMHKHMLSFYCKILIFCKICFVVGTNI
jgi:hypothetical protein